MNILPRIKSYGTFLTVTRGKWETFPPTKLTILHMFLYIKTCIIILHMFLVCLYIYICNIPLCTCIYVSFWNIFSARSLSTESQYSICFIYFKLYFIQKCKVVSILVNSSNIAGSNTQSSDRLLFLQFSLHLKWVDEH